MRSQDVIRLGIFPDADFYRARAALYRHQADAAEVSGERDRLKALARKIEAKATAEERASQRYRDTQLERPGNGTAGTATIS